MAVSKCFHQGAIARQPARFEQRGFDRDVGVRLALAVGDACVRCAPAPGPGPTAAATSRSMADSSSGDGVLRQQDEQVDVGVRIQFPASVSAHRGQHGAGGQRTLLDQVAQCLVGDPPQLVRAADRAVLCSRKAAMAASRRARMRARSAGRSAAAVSVAVAEDSTCVLMRRSFQGSRP